MAMYKHVKATWETEASPKFKIDKIAVPEGSASRNICETLILKHYNCSTLIFMVESDLCVNIWVFCNPCF